MKKIQKIKSVILMFLALQSCNSLTLVDTKEATAKIQELKAEKRVSYFVYDQASKRTYILSEPSPDVMLEKTTSIANKLSLKEGEKEVLTTDQKVDLASKVIKLGERTVAISILRDALYRLSELNVNNRNEKLEEGYKVLFDSILSASKQVAMTEIMNAEKELKEAENKNLIIKEVEKQTALESYQKGFELLLNKDSNAINHFNNLYKEYPEHFNIMEINKKIKSLSKEGMNDEEWNELYKDIVKDKLWKIDEKLQEQLKEKIKEKK